MLRLVKSNIMDAMCQLTILFVYLLFYSIDACNTPIIDYSYAISIKFVWLITLPN